MPLVVRAREYHLYDRSGRRYLDFFQNHGRAILGHRPEGMLRAMKGTASRGLVAEYPSVHRGRLETIVEQLLPGFHAVRLYSELRYAKDVLRRVFGSDGASLAIADPALFDPSPGDAVSFWRPFLVDVGITAEVLIPVLPFPGSFVCEVVCVKDMALADRLPPSDPVSPLVLDLLVKASGALLGIGDEERKRFQQENPLRGLVARTCGPYCATGMDESEFRRFHAAALEAGVLLPPGPDVPIIVPPVRTEGEVAPFLRVVKDFFGRG